MTFFEIWYTDPLTLVYPPQEPPSCSWRGLRCTTMRRWVSPPSPRPGVRNSSQAASLFPGRAYSSNTFLMHFASRFEHVTNDKWTGMLPMSYHRSS